jgi:integrase
MASFVKRSSGTWAYVVNGPRDPSTGRYSQRWVSGFRTKKAAVEAYELEMADRRSGRHVPPSRLTVGEFLTDRWLPAVEGSVRPSTFAYHRYRVERTIVPALGRIALQQLGADDLERFYAQLGKTGRIRGEGGLSPQSIRHIHATIRRALNDAVRWKLVQHNVAIGVRLPKATQPEMKIWSPEQLGMFLDQVRDDRLFAAWFLLCTTGLRRGEVCGLTWSAVDLDQGTLNVVKTIVSVAYRLEVGEPKTAKGRRSIALDVATVGELRAHRIRQLEERVAWGSAFDDQDLVFCKEDGSPIHPERLTIMFGRLSDAAGLPHIRLHDLRHSYATAALAAGVPVKVVSDRLGHANVGITSDLYMHVPDEMDRDAAERVADSILKRRG